MIQLLEIIMKWRKQVLFFTLLSVLIASVITAPFIMPPYYKSKMAFYLSNPISTDRAALFNEKEGGGVSIFGGKEDINRFLSILNSAPVSLHIIQKYKLKAHYNIPDDDKELSLYYTQKEFFGNFKAIKNDLGAIEVSIEDIDPSLAASMASDIVMQADSVYRAMLVENKSAVLALLDKQIVLKDSEKQKSASSALSDELARLNTIRDQYEVSASANFKTIYVVEEPKPAAKKSSPVRWLIVLLSMVFSFVLASLTAMAIELYKNADKYGFNRS